jgi:D-glucosaminate-6-phosphate ammonia-lyase
MAHIYEQLGVPTLINAVGPSTRLSGGIMRPEVAEAMTQASQYCVDIAQLQARAGRLIAAYTGAEAGYVTNGAAAGLLLGTAACVTGLDPSKMNRLPDTRGMKNQVVMARSHRNFYDHAVRTAGVELVEVGIADRFSGAGVRDTEAWEIEAALTDQTACVLYVAHAHSQPDLAAVVEVAHRQGVPVLVDAAGQLPPASNLTHFISLGADLVCFSGGKTIGGPQSSGLLCGRRDLIQAAALQHLDLDIFYDQWEPPPELIDKNALPGAPHHGIGRPCKVGKEEIAGLLKALELFVAEDPKARREGWRQKMAALIDAAGDLPHASLELADDPKRSEIPAVNLRLDEEALGFTAFELVLRLQRGTPSIQANPTYVDQAMVTFGPMCLRDGEAEQVGHRLRQELGAD